MCIGKALAVIILTSIMARILSEFRLRLPADQLEVEPDVSIVMQPRDGLRLIVERRPVDHPTDAMHQ